MSGCPVLCSGIGGMAEKVLDGVSGLHFRVSSATDLMRAIEQAADPVLHTKLAGSLPDVFDHLKMAQRYIDVFKSSDCHGSC